MSLSLRWGFLPKEIRDSVRPMLLNYLWILPTWVHTLDVRYIVRHPDNSSTTAALTSNPSYRHLTLMVYAEWMNESPARRERIILHEAIHATYGPLLVAAHEAVRAFVSEDSPGYKIAMESLRSTSEGATVDLERALFGKHFPPPPFTEEEDEQAPAADIIARAGQTTDTT